MIGNVLGNYKVVEKIGEGGMGAVYRGVDLMLEREVAIKALRPELGNQPQIVERFRSEAVTLAKLNHPNVATLYSFFRQGDDFFMVMEFVRGETLDNIIAARGAMSCGQAIPMFSQVLEGIDHAHRLGIIHRDIKPANMMLTESGTLKVLDFGIARVLGSSRMTKTGHLIGTIEYMSPEQVRGQETDARSDIYSLGMLLYEMLTGRVPFKSDSEFELMKSQVESVPPPPREFAPHIPEVVERAILCSLAKNPAERFQTAGAFRNALMGAGFAATLMDIPQPGQTSSNSLYATTPFKEPPSIPQTPTSQPSIAPPPPISHDINKETRLAPGIGNTPSANAAPASSVLKETRIGASLASTPTSSPAPPAAEIRGMSQALPPQHTSASFFSKLNWKHYTAAGLVVVVLLFVIIAVPVGLLVMSGSTKKTQSTTPAPNANQQIVSPPPSEAQSTSKSTEDAPIIPGQSSTQADVSTTTANTVTSDKKPTDTLPVIPSGTAQRPPAPAQKNNAAAQEEARRRAAAAADLARRRALAKKLAEQ